MAGLYVGRLEAGSAFTLEASELAKHAVVLGATGSGKTVLCKAIVEELALQGVPVLAIDPKGDVGCLAIASPDFEFRPWSDREAEEAGLDPEEYSERLAEEYARRLSEWGVSRERVEAYCEGVEVVIYTPRSGCGVPLSVRPSLEPPPNVRELLDRDPAAVLDALGGCVSALLKLAGYSDRDCLLYTSPSPRDRG